MAAPSSDFEVFYGQATDLAKAFPEYQFQTVAAMLVIIGWLVSSDVAQQFIALHANTALPWGIAAFVLLAVLKGIWIYRHYARMNVLYANLVRLAPGQSLSIESLAQLNIGKMLPVTYVIVNTVLCIAGSVVLWLICHGKV